MNDMHQVPDGWRRIELGELLLSIEAGKSFKCLERPPSQSEVGVVKVSAVTWGVYDESESKTCTRPELVRPHLFVQPDDFLFSRANTIELVGACVIAKRVSRRVMLSDKILRLRFAEGADRWMLWALRSGAGRYEIERLATGNQDSMRNIGQARIRQIRVPLAPTPERDRIVEAIESYLTRLDDAVATLKRVQRNLKRYRASVLKAAVEGRLVPTEAELSRAEGREYEPATVLLDRILAERRRRWEEAELAKLTAKGKPPKNDKWKAKYKEPVAPDTADLPELPEGWCWATVDMLAHEVRYGSSAKCRKERGDGVPVLRMGNIVDGQLDFGALKYLPRDHGEFPDLLLTEGDLVFNRTNSAELVGKTAVFKAYPTPVSFASYLIRARFCPGVRPGLVAAYINSPGGRRWIASVVTQQVGQANVNGTKLRKCVIPLPPEPEQTRIVQELERLQSVTESSRRSVAREVERCSRLRQAILKWAFEGKLADQDPHDEPAADLLKRIQAERAKVAATPRRRRRGRA